MRIPSANRRRQQHNQIHHQKYIRSRRRKWKYGVILVAVCFAILYLGMLLTTTTSTSSATNNNNCYQSVFSMEESLSHQAARLWSSSSLLQDSSNPLRASISSRKPPTKPLPSRTKDAKGDCHLAYQTNNNNHTPPIIQWSPLRLIIFQRDTGLQLVRQLSYYLSVLEPQDIVVINHLGTDPFTTQILEQYAASSSGDTSGRQLEHENRGIHVWNCTGPWIQKHRMWTQVTKLYAPYSDYVVPLDVDEYLAVVNNDKTTSDNEKITPSAHSVTWNPQALHTALSKLGNRGVPFKLTQYSAVPFDCLAVAAGPDTTLLSSAKINTHEGNRFSSSCHVHVYSDPQNTNPRYACFWKTFARGREFARTDQGNHLGGTRKSASLAAMHQGCFLESRPITDFWDVADSLALIHMNPTSFAEWLLHTLRGAGDYGYNNYTAVVEENKPMNCTAIAKKGAHYCRDWQALAERRFDVWEMKELYYKEQCRPHASLATTRGEEKAVGTSNSSTKIEYAQLMLPRCT